MNEAEQDDADLDALVDDAAADLAHDGRPRAGDKALIARSIELAITRTKARSPHGFARRRRSAYAAAWAAAVLVVAGGAFGWIERAKTERPAPEATEPLQRGASAAVPASVTPEVASAIEAPSTETASSAAPRVPSLGVTAAKSLRKPTTHGGAATLQPRPDNTACCRGGSRVPPKHRFRMSLSGACTLIDSAIQGVRSPSSMNTSQEAVTVIWARRRWWAGRSRFNGWGARTKRGARGVRSSRQSRARCRPIVRVRAWPSCTELSASSMLAPCLYGAE